MQTDAMESKAPQTELTELLEVLNQEIREHQALETELGNEAALDGTISGDSLLKIQGRKNACVRAIRDLEARRMGIVQRIAEDWAEPAETVTLRRIVARSPKAIGGALERCHSDLMKLTGTIRELALLTSQNAQSRLKAIDATLAVIKEALKIHTTYSEGGRLQKRTPTLKSTSA